MKQIESVEKQVRRVKRKFYLLIKEDKAGIPFLLLGLVLMSLSFVGFVFTDKTGFSLSSSFFIAFLLTELLLMGFSLIHKSLRGAWL